MEENYGYIEIRLKELLVFHPTEKNRKRVLLILNGEHPDF